MCEAASSSLRGQVLRVPARERGTYLGRGGGELDLRVAVADQEERGGGRGGQRPPEDLRHRGVHLRRGGEGQPADGQRRALGGVEGDQRIVGGGQEVAGVDDERRHLVQLRAAPAIPAGRRWRHRRAGRSAAWSTRSPVAFWRKVADCGGVLLSTGELVVDVVDVHRGDLQSIRAAAHRPERRGWGAAPGSDDDQVGTGVGVPAARGIGHHRRRREHVLVAVGVEGPRAGSGGGEAGPGLASRWWRRRPGASGLVMSRTWAEAASCASQLDHRAARRP